MEETGIYARESAELGRAVQLGIASGRVLSVSFPASIPADAEESHPLLDRVFAYLDGAADDFADVQLALTVPTETRRVLEAVRKVPYGETASLSQVTTLAGLDANEPDDLDRVDAALAANPLPVFIPDHRIRRESGATPSEIAEALRRLEA
ncbi:MGMT family protein [Haloferacaceae archaeon DSL9]